MGIATVAVKQRIVEYQARHGDERPTQVIVIPQALSEDFH